MKVPYCHLWVTKHAHEHSWTTKNFNLTWLYCNVELTLSVKILLLIIIIIVLLLSLFCIMKQCVLVSDVWHTAAGVIRPLQQPAYVAEPLMVNQRPRLCFNKAKTRTCWFSFQEFFAFKQKEKWRETLEVEPYRCCEVINININFITFCPVRKMSDTR